MAKEFKTPEKFIFNNANVRYNMNKNPILVGSDSDPLDEIRAYLGLTTLAHTHLGDTDSVVSYSPSEAKPNYTAYLNLLHAAGGLFGIQRNSNLLPKQVDVDSDEYKAQAQRESSIIDDMKSLEGFIEEGESENYVYQDFNFQLPSKNRPSLGVETFLRGLNEFDIRSNSPGGELDPTKEETSLKFAYAFQTIGIQGSSEVVKKQVKVANNFQELFEKADNTKNLPTKIERLKNILYGGLTTKDLKAQSDAVLEGSATVQANDSKNNISIDKLYNVVTIDVPAKPKVKTDFFSYLVENQEQLGFGVDLTDLALKFYEPRINRFNAQERILYDLAPPAGSLGAKKVTAGTMFNQVETQSDSSESTTKIPLNYLGLVKNNREQPDPAEGLKFLTKDQIVNIEETQGPNQTIATRLEPYVIDSNTLKAQIPLVLRAWLHGSHTGFQEYPITTNYNYFSTTAGQLNKYSISNLMRSAAKFINPKKQTNFLFPASSRLNSMFADPQLIGFKVVKSRLPYNTATQSSDPAKKDFSSSFSNSIIQTFYINASQSEEVSTVRLYDSQIIYGEKYYYTLFGIYSVDGKYYYYENKGLTIEDEKYELLKEAKYQEIKTLHPNVGEGGEFKNPCCKFKDYSGRIIVEESIAGNGYIMTLTATDLDTKLTALHDAVTGVGTNKQKIWNTLINMTDAEMCYLCKQERFYYGDWNKSMVARVQEDLSGTDLKKFNDLLKCVQFTSALDSTMNQPNTKGDSNDVGSPDDKQPCEVFHKTQGVLISAQEGAGTPKTFKEFRFTIKEMNARRTYEFPLQPSVDNTIINFVPLPPDATFVTLKGATDRVMIKFETLQKTSTNFYKDGSLVHYAGFYYQPTDGVVDTLNGALYQGLLTKSEDHAQNNQIDIAEPVAGKIDLAIGVGAILARAEQDVKEIHAFKLDRTPTSREDLVLSGDRYVLNLLNGETAYFSNLKPNQKYYYVFASRDITGLYSGGTEVYQVEIVEDSGYSYTKVGIYDFVTKETKETTKSFKKLLKIKPSFEETLPSDAANVGSTNLFSTIKFTDGGAFGGGAQPSKFKIRIRSKKTKRVFDINIKYTQEIKKILTKKFLKQIKTHSTLIDTKDEGTN